MNAQFKAWKDCPYWAQTKLDRAWRELIAMYSKVGLSAEAIRPSEIVARAMALAA